VDLAGPARGFEGNRQELHPQLFQLLAVNFIGWQRWACLGNHEFSEMPDSLFPSFSSVQ